MRGCSGVGSVGYNAYTNKVAKDLGALDLSDEDIQMFIESGLESDPETESYKIAAEMKQKLDDDKKLSARDLSRLYQANTAAQPNASWGKETEQEQAGAEGEAADNSGKSNARALFDAYQGEQKRDSAWAVRKPATEAAPVESVSAERQFVRDLMTAGTVSNKDADRILDNAKYVEAFESETGIQLSGTKAQKRNAIIQGAAAYAEGQKLRSQTQGAASTQSSRETGNESDDLRRSGEALYTGETLQSYLAHDRGNVPVEQYRDGYNSFYTYGRITAEATKPVSFEAARAGLSVYAQWIGDDAAQAAVDIAWARAVQVVLL